MRRILDRYIFREIASTWLGVTMVLLLILLTNQFARILGDVAQGKLPKGAALDVIGLSAAQYLTIIVPIGFFLSVMLALGRLYRDSEMPAMMACRVGPGGIYRPLLWLLVPLAAAVAWLSLDLAPRRSSPRSGPREYGARPFHRSWAKQRSCLRRTHLAGRFHGECLPATSCRQWQRRSGGRTAR